MYLRTLCFKSSNRKKDWVRKPQIRKVPQLRKVRQEHQGQATTAETMATTGVLATEGRPSKYHEHHGKARGAGMIATAEL